jgi:hypothetical protein
LPEGINCQYIIPTMTLTAHVRAGRLIVDEPTDLPDGTTVELIPIDPSLDGGAVQALFDAIWECRVETGLDRDKLRALLEARWQASEAGEPTETAAEVREHFRRRAADARPPA